MSGSQRPLRILCVSKRFSHHSASGGYDRLPEFLAASVIGRPVLRSFAPRAMEKLWNYRNGQRLIHPHYRFEDSLAEEQAFWTALRGRFDIIHALNGDEQIDVLLRRINLLPARLVLSVHYPVARIKQIFANVPLATRAKIGGVVAVGSHDVPELAEWFGADKVIYAPHGIDTDAFTPDDLRKGEPTARFLFIGAHMRDFEMAHRAIDRCAQAGVDAVFDLVLPTDKQAFFTGCTNVRRHVGISEPELRALYRQADALFLPLVDATANNSILEALACGAPVITTRVGSIGSYVDDSCGWLLPPGDHEAAFDCLSTIVADRGLADRRRAAARTKGMGFAWPNVARPILDAYERLVRTGRFAP